MILFGDELKTVKIYDFLFWDFEHYLQVRDYIPVGTPLGTSLRQPWPQLCEKFSWGRYPLVNVDSLRT